MEVEIELSNGCTPITEDEKQAYIQHVKSTYPDRTIEKITIEVDGEYVNLRTYFKPIKFERVRRITGYLVGTLDRFNDAKLAEVKDRVPHN